MSGERYFLTSMARFAPEVESLLKRVGVPGAVFGGGRLALPTLSAEMERVMAEALERRRSAIERVTALAFRRVHADLRPDDVDPAAWSDVQPRWDWGGPVQAQEQGDDS